MLDKLHPDCPQHSSIVSRSANRWVRVYDYSHGHAPQITCVEINPDYLRGGKKLLREANWIRADIFDIWEDLPRDFTGTISTPFGKIKHAGSSPRPCCAYHRIGCIHPAADVGILPTFS
ncbi:MAG TPA: hypothetical protein VHZ55_09880 [Bryobacteraceae bacterium]|nr:hypothetical protein [Bryobacteraceae bacterium]